MTTCLPVDDPATGRPFTEVPVTSARELDAVVARAAGAFPAWAASLDDRRAALRACGALVHDAADELAELLTREQGKPLARALAEVRLSADWFGWTADLSLDPESLPDTGPGQVTLHRRPLGVVGAITPWNYPVILAVAKLAPALLAGNTVVLKPSPFTPVTTLRLGALLASVLPPGVLDVVVGGDDLGEQLVASPAVRKVSLTGSIEAGVAVMRTAARDLTRVTLELGGNDAAIVLPDVDVDAIAPELFARAFENSGQYCCAVKRIYAHADVAADVVDALAALAAGAVVGDGLDPRTELGPLTTRFQLDRVDRLVSAARQAGARVVQGGHRLERAGWFYAPTIVTDLPDGTALELEEQFGPAVPVIACASVDEAVARANGVVHGLGGSVWSADVQRASAIAGRLECGTAWVNTHGALLATVPFGGAKQSGIGVEYGRWGLAEFTQLQAVHVAYQ